MSNEMKDVVKATLNRGQIVGSLSEKNLQVVDGKITVKDKEVACKVVKGDIVISNANGDFKLRIYANSLTKNGEENKMYRGFETVANDYISKLDAVKNNTQADYVKCSFRVGVNDYKGQDGKVKTVTQFDLQSVTRVSAEKEEEKMELSIIGGLRNIKPETKKKGDDVEETGRLIGEVIAVGFTGEALPVEFAVPEDLAKDFEEYYEKGDTVELSLEGKMAHYGAETKARAGGFGRKAQVYDGFDRFEFVLMGGEPKIEEENEAYLSKETLSALMNARAEKLDALEKAEKKAKATEPVKKSIGKKAVVDDDELPF